MQTKTVSLPSATLAYEKYGDSFATFVLMRWDTADGKDRIALLSQEPSCSSLYHFFNHLQLLFSIDHVRNAS